MLGTWEVHSAAATVQLILDLPRTKAVSLGRSVEVPVKSGCNPPSAVSLMGTLPTVVTYLLEAHRLKHHIVTFNDLTFFSISSSDVHAYIFCHILEFL